MNNIIQTSEHAHTHICMENIMLHGLHVVSRVKGQEPRHLVRWELRILLTVQMV